MYHYVQNKMDYPIAFLFVGKSAETLYLSVVGAFRK